MGAVDEWKVQWALNLKVGRRRQKLSQRALAKKLGVTQAAVGRWETCAAIPTDANKIRIAEALDEDVRTLFPLVRSAS